MFSYPESTDVLDALGDKVVQSLARATTKSKDDLTLYRTTFPRWVVEHSERGLADWIHDRLWAHLGELLGEDPDVTLFDNGTTHEMTVRLAYRLRIKRHDSKSRISTYPTQTALGFYTQDLAKTMLDGGVEIRLSAGYRWISAQREIGAAVLSLRDGKDNVIWECTLPDEEEEMGGGTVLRVPPEPEPTPPVIDINFVNEDEAETGKPEGEPT